jgi:hypothetical protein
MDLASGSVYTIPTIIFGVSIGLIKLLECIQMKYISNTKRIIKQSEQIQFLLIRLVDLNKKIAKLEINMNTSSSSTILDDVSNEDQGDEIDEEVDDIIGNEEPVDNENENLNKNDEVIIKNFEIIESVPHDIPTKKKGWLPFLF